MAQIKCKMCGGSLNVQENTSVIECEYCGTTQTIPSFSNEKITALHNRANSLRLKNDFDKAIVTYENIIEDSPNDAEAHWGLLLCKYGIEYVDDPKTGKKIPTCHRTQVKSIFNDVDYKAVIDNSDVLSKRVYEAEAEEIEKIQKSILAISQKADPYDVFICYKESDSEGKRTRDSVIAQEIYDVLTEKKYKVFFAKITLESKLGSQYEPHIFAALNSAKVMLVLGTKPEYFNAVWVKNEWSRFISIIEESNHQKYLIPCYRDMDAYDLPDELVTFQSQDMNKLGFIQDLIRGIDKIFEGTVNNSVSNTHTHNQVDNLSINKNISNLLKRAKLSIEFGEYGKAKQVIEEVLNENVECAQAYVMLILIEKSLNKEEDLMNLSEPLDQNKNYIKALRFAEDEYKKELENYNEIIKDNKKNIYFELLEKAKKIKSEINQFINISQYYEIKEILNKLEEIVAYNNEVSELIEYFTIIIKPIERIEPYLKGKTIDYTNPFEQVSGGKDAIEFRGDDFVIYETIRSKAAEGTPNYYNTLIGGNDLKVESKYISYRDIKCVFVRREIGDRYSIIIKYFNFDESKCVSFKLGDYYFAIIYDIFEILSREYGFKLEEEQLNQRSKRVRVGFSITKFISIFFIIIEVFIPIAIGCIVYFDFCDSILLANILGVIWFIILINLITALG